jgi:hypothetical protein
VDWYYSSSRKAYDGILLIWDRRVVEKIQECVWECIIAYSFRNVEDGFSWAFGGVYRANSDCDKRYLWEELAGLLSWWNLSWCIRKDFNVARFPSERLGEAPFCPTMWSSQILFLIRASWTLVGGTFTWSNNRDPPSWFRIGRFLVSLDWETQSLDLSQKRLPRLCLNHFSIFFFDK